MKALTTSTIRNKLFKILTYEITSFLCFHFFFSSFFSYLFRKQLKVTLPKSIYEWRASGGEGRAHNRKIRCMSDTHTQQYKHICHEQNAPVEKLKIYKYIAINWKRTYIIYTCTECPLVVLFGPFVFTCLLRKLS